MNPVVVMTVRGKRGRPKGSKNKSKAGKRMKKHVQAVIASLGPGWRDAELIYDPKLRDSKGHLKRGVRYVLDRKAGYKV